MILRKPYAFFIKNFKLMHMILTILIAYLLYRTGLSLTFFNEYISTNVSVIDQDLTGTLFNIYMFIIPFFIILATMIILSVMYVKKKPILFYITIIIIYASMLFVYNYVYSTLGLMEAKLLDIRTVRLARDILMMAFIAQVLSVIIAFIRTTGFDIKKFNFGQDLAALEISEEDREEFEVEVVVDTDRVQRRLRRKARYARYVYIENKFLIHITTLIIIAVVCFVVYLNSTIYNKIYSEKEAFLATDFSMRINKSYVTSKDYSGTITTGEETSLIVLEIELKNNYLKPQKLEIVRTQLVIGGKIFYHQYNYKEKLFDLGKAYDDELLFNQFTKYLLVYEVPKTALNNPQIEFRYSDKIDYTGGKLSPKYVTVDIVPEVLDKKTKTNDYVIGDEVLFEESVLGDTKLVINKYDIADQFKLNYQFCVSDTECYESYEYLLPDISNQYDKTILYLNGIIVWDETLTIEPITDVYNFVDLFGTVIYEIGGETKIQKVALNEVKSTKVLKTNDYYIELLREVKQADKISIVFDVRDIKYRYVIK